MTRPRWRPRAALPWIVPAILAIRAAVGHDALVAVGYEPWTLALAWSVPFLVLALVSAIRLSLPVGILLAAAASVPFALRPPPGGGDPVPALASVPHVVLLTLDTFRGDYLSAAGGPVATPSLDRLAASGAIFRQAVTTVPLTAPAHATLLTGRTDHGLRANGRQLAAESIVAEIRSHGYRTGAFVSAAVLGRQTGLSEGFDHYDDRWGARARHDWLLGPSPVGTRSGLDTVERALRWLSGDPSPAFLWVHLYDPHAPYLPPEAWRPDAAAREAASAIDGARRKAMDKKFLAATLETGFIESQKLLYRAEVAWTDHVVGRLLEGLPEDAIVVAVGDHGESLEEHGYYFNHGGNLLEPSLHVPLLLRWKGRVAAQTESERLVGITAVAPTLRLATGLDTGAPTLLDVVRGDAPEATVEAFTPGMQAHARLTARGPSGAVAALRSEAGKLVVDGTKAEWYDLRADPGELSPLPVPDEWAGEVERLRARVLAPAPELTEEEANRLRWLGYVE